MLINFARSLFLLKVPFMRLLQNEGYSLYRWSSYFLNSYSGLFNVVKVVSGIHGKMAIALL